VAVAIVGLRYRDIMLPQSPTLWTAVAAIAVCANAITAFLLWVPQPNRRFDRPLAGIRSAYAYAAALGVPYFVAVPLMLAPGGPETHLTQACWALWHIVFPVGVFATVIALRRVPERLVLQVGMVVSFLTVRPLYRALGPWICAALSTSALEVISRVFSGQPYTVGFYVARLEMLLASMIVLIAMLADIDRIYRRMSRLVTHDYLAELLNRATFETRFEVALGYATRNKTPLVVLIIDVDHFKGYNDRYGHIRGDHALQAVSAAIAASASRRSDVAGRLGGEEFALVLGVADLDGAQHVANRFCPP
jgi:GGDEF domain-containing protein